jgi:hypothetical protein
MTSASNNAITAGQGGGSNVQPPSSLTRTLGVGHLHTAAETNETLERIFDGR